MVTLREKKILVVDDEVSILTMFKEIFNSEGYSVRTAKSAEEAFKILEGESIRVMFFDLRLPAMSGIDLCWKIREKDQMSIIYAVTGYSTFYGLLECRAAGFDDFFVKPVETKLLLQATEDAFEKLERWNIRDYDIE